jgi:hypothetical protein
MIRVVKEVKKHAREISELQAQVKAIQSQR